MMRGYEMLRKTGRQRRYPRRERFEPTWEVAPHDVGEVPTSWVPARVPGAAQLDWSAAQNWGDYHYSDNWTRFSGLEDFYWTYRTSVPNLDGGFARHALVLEGTDYEARIRIDGATVSHTRGLYSSTVVQLDCSASGAELQVELAPVHKAAPPRLGGIWDWTESGRGQACETTKTLDSFGEDFQPRVLSQGIWKPAYFERTAGPSFADLRIDDRVDASTGEAVLRIDGAVSDGDSTQPIRVQLQVVDPTGSPCLFHVVPVSRGRFAAEVRISNVRLWWPVGTGPADLYDLCVDLLGAEDTVLDTCRQRVGFRTVTLRHDASAWSDPPAEQYPKSRTPPPMRFVVNGKAVFAAGTSVVPPRLFQGAVVANDYRVLVDKASAIGFNLIRNSGGGFVFHDEFYEYCDHAGMMVWQDFPLACNTYPDHDAYLDLLRTEAEAIVDTLRHHPSIVAWCAGNELFSAWSQMSEHSLPVRLLNSVTFERDAQRPFIPTSPQMGTGHGYYMFENFATDHVEENTSYIWRSRMLAYPEMACNSVATLDALRMAIPEDELFPPEPGGAWEGHKAFFAWDRREDSWIGLASVERHFGHPRSIEDLVLFSQLLQAVCLRTLMEEARRQPGCHLGMTWCLNEPWPTAANLSLLSWPADEKLAARWLRLALRPTCMVVILERFRWHVGEQMEIRVAVLVQAGARFAGAADAKVELSRLDASREWYPVLDLGPVAPTDTTQTLDTHTFTLPRKPGFYELRLQSDDAPHLSSRYLISVVAETSSGPDEATLEALRHHDLVRESQGYFSTRESIET